MKSFLIFLILLIATCAVAQEGIQFGNEGMTVKAGTTLSYQGLTLTPSTELQINATFLYMSNIPATINSKKSVNYVYRFMTAIDFNGKAQIDFVPAELNGNDAAKLRLALATDEIQGFTLLPSTSANNEVFGNISNSKFKMLTAIESGTALPVRIVDFTANIESNTAVLKWITSMETNARLFEIEHSVDTKTWNHVGETEAAGESSERVKYQFIHQNVANGLNYYRLKMVDNDDTFAYSKIRSVKFNLKEFITIYPNPASERIQLQYDSKAKIKNVSIYDKSGISRYQSTIFPQTGILLNNFLSGSYVLIITRDDGSRSSHPFIKL